jgi:hypothetical protein
MQAELLMPGPVVYLVVPPIASDVAGTAEPEDFLVALNRSSTVSGILF